MSDFDESELVFKKFVESLRKSQCDYLAGSTLQRSKRLKEMLQMIRATYRRKGYSMEKEVSYALADLDFLSDELELEAKVFRRGKDNGRKRTYQKH